MKRRGADDHIRFGRRLRNMPAFRIAVGAAGGDAALKAAGVDKFAQLRRTVARYVVGEVYEQEVDFYLHRVDLRTLEDLNKIAEIAETTGFLEKVRDRYLAYRIPDILENREQFLARLVVPDFYRANDSETLLESLYNTGASKQVIRLDGIAEMAIHNAASVMIRQDISFGKLLRSLLIGGKDSFDSTHENAIDYLARLKLQRDEDGRERAKNLIRFLMFDAESYAKFLNIPLTKYGAYCRKKVAERFNQLRREAVAFDASAVSLTNSRSPR